jgi:glutamyl-tRNA synthetase
MDLNSSETKKVVTRYAPSPTGFQHIGGIRTALFAYLFARQNKGIFILRIEDTDKERQVAGAIEHTQEALKWIGINWDYGPDTDTPFGSVIQSERLAIYKKYAEKLIEKGLAYPDPYTPEEVAAFKETAIAEKLPFLIRNHRPSEFGVWDGSKPLRLKVPEIKRYTWNDVTRGTLSAGEEMLDDVVLIKSDGYPTYTFAHIIDDLEMGVTHIMRADEFISSMPKFLSIYDALEIPYPVFVTLPPILRDDRTKKLGKRDGAKDILDYRADGYLPSAMMNFLALTGWNPGTEQEVFSHDELIVAFDITKIQKAGAAFNEEKLLWMNRQHLNLLTPEEFSAYLAPAIPETFTSAPQYTAETLTRLVPTIRERINTLAEFHTEVAEGEYDWAFTAPTYETDILKWKNDTDVKQARPRLQHALELLKNADFSSSETIKASLWGYAEEVGKGELLWPLRVCLSGKAQSPDPFTLAYTIGQLETLARIQTACDKIGE